MHSTDYGVHHSPRLARLRQSPTYPMNRLTSHLFVRYVFSGLLVTFVSLSISGTLLWIGVSASFAVSIGYLLSSLFGYLIHSLVSFRNRLMGRFPPFPEYVLLLLISFLAAYTGGILLTSWLGTNIASIAISICIPVLVNYSLWLQLIRRNARRNAAKVGRVSKGY